MASGKMPLKMPSSIKANGSLWLKRATAASTRLESRPRPRSVVTIKVFASPLHNETKDPNESQVASLSWPPILP